MAVPLACKDEVKDEVMDPSLQYTDCWNHSFPRDADVTGIEDEEDDCVHGPLWF